MYKGCFWPLWGGGVLYNSDAFAQGGKDGISPTLRAEKNDASVLIEDKDMAKIFRIRKLTERECLRLMGLSDDQIDLIANYPCIKDADDNWVLPEGMTEKEAKNLKISASQMYKMAGNSIVVPVLEGIFTQMFKAERDTLF